MDIQAPFYDIDYSFNENELDDLPDNPPPLVRDDYVNNPYSVNDIYNTIDNYNIINDYNNNYHNEDELTLDDDPDDVVVRNRRGERITLTEFAEKQGVKRSHIIRLMFMFRNLFGITDYYNVVKYSKIVEKDYKVFLRFAEYYAIPKDRERFVYNEIQQSLILQVQ